MKQKANNKYKIKLANGIIHLSQGEMIIVLHRVKFDSWFDSNDMGLEQAFLNPPKSYYGLSDEKLIQEVQKHFSDSSKIIEILRKQKEVLKTIYSLMKKDKKMLKEFKKAWDKVGLSSRRLS